MVGKNRKNHYKRGVRQSRGRGNRRNGARGRGVRGVGRHVQIQNSYVRQMGEHYYDYYYPIDFILYSIPIF